jgi:hypothetical protein
MALNVDLSDFLDDAPTTGAPEKKAAAPKSSVKVDLSDFLDDSGAPTEDPGLMKTLGDSLKRGVPSLKQGGAATIFRANAKNVEILDSVEAGLKAGKKPEDFKGDADPIGAAFMTQAQRDDLRKQVDASLTTSAANIATTEAEKRALPPPKVVQDVMGAKTFKEAFGAFMTDPVKFIAALGPESLVSNAPGIIAGKFTPGGLALKGAVMGAGSAATDYGSSIVQGLQEHGVDVTNPDALKAAAADSKLMSKVAQEAQSHAQIVGGMDALSGAAASKLGLPGQVLAKSPVKRKIADTIVEAPIQGAFGAAGEAGGEMNAGQQFQPGNILAEFAGEFFGSPAEMAAIGTHAIRTPTASTVAAQVQQAATPQPTQTQQLAASAFADVGGDDGVRAGQTAEKAKIALSLSQIAEHDGPEALNKAVQHLSGGDAAVAQQLVAASQDPALIEQAKASLDGDTIGYVRTNDAIRTEAGLVEEQAPAAPAASEEATPSAPAAPAPELQMQVQAVKDGLMPGVVVPTEVARQLDLNGLETGVARGQDGREATVIGKTPEDVQAAVSRAFDVGIDQVAAELSAPAQGKAVVQTHDANTGEVLNQQVVTPDQAGEAAGGDGRSTVVRPVADVLAERAAQLPQVEQIAQAAAPAVTEAPGPTFFSRGDKAASAPVAFTATEQTGAAARVVAKINQSLGLQGDQAINPASITEVSPPVPMRRLAKAVKAAFGVDIVFVHAENGLTRHDGGAFNTFQGIADRDGKTIVLNVQANVPLSVLGHELVHVLESAAPALYDRLEMVVLSRMRAKAAERLKARLEAAVQSEGGTASAAEFRREVVAEAVGEMAQDAKLWEDVFSGQKPEAVQSFYQKVLDVIAKLQRALTSAGYVTGVKDIATVKKAVTQAFKDWSAQHEQSEEGKAQLTPQVLRC